MVFNIMVLSCAEIRSGKWVRCASVLGQVCGYAVQCLRDVLGTTKTGIRQHMIDGMALKHATICSLRQRSTMGARISMETITR